LRWPPKKNLIINRDASGGYCKTAVSRWPFSQTKIKMSNKKAALLAGMLAATMAEQERKDYFEFTNPYAGLEGLTYSGSGQKSYSKSPMTNKQKKSRAASKRAKQARKRGR